MQKKSGLHIVLGMIIGALLGVFFSPAVEINLSAFALGVLGGAFSGVLVGWFVTTGVRERTTHKSDQNT